MMQRGLGALRGVVTCKEGYGHRVSLLARQSDRPGLRDSDYWSDGASAASVYKLRGSLGVSRE